MGLGSGTKLVSVFVTRGADLLVELSRFENSRNVEITVNLARFALIPFP
jgi:hypothetical protein